MNLTAAGLLAITFSFATLAAMAVAYVAPWMRRHSLAVALSACLWIHAFRYVALQIFSARRFGFDLPLSAAREIAFGDVAGAALALLGLWLLARGSRHALLVIWLFAIETALDLAWGTVLGIHDKALHTAHDVTWLILNFYVPLLWVSLGLVVWQLASRRDEPLTGVQ